MARARIDIPHCENARYANEESLQTPSQGVILVEALYLVAASQDPSHQLKNVLSDHEFQTK